MFAAFRSDQRQDMMLPSAELFEQFLQHLVKQYQLHQHFVQDTVVDIQPVFQSDSGTLQTDPGSGSSAQVSDRGVQHFEVSTMSGRRFQAQKVVCALGGTNFAVCIREDRIAVPAQYPILIASCVYRRNQTGSGRFVLAASRRSSTRPIWPQRQVTLPSRSWCQMLES